MPETDQSKKTQKPFFESINTGNLLIQFNQEMAKEISTIIIDTFEDGDPPAVWAFAKQLETYAARCSHAVCDESQET